jgi:hypothetical protein
LIKPALRMNCTSYLILIVEELCTFLHFDCPFHRKNGWWEPSQVPFACRPLAQVFHSISAKKIKKLTQLFRCPELVFAE